ncbi:putative rhamnosidase B [Aspergillus homomorphus CBS 101889]|uniref:Six-hairpin glycosidase n=1 Tax=Aspergillus homomorphus (strain CBS 101889) TaxID=1450537 RepID=A0A395HQX4_ASPHC|nr:Six-hairpin glycosidase [Aspergillus homomorphus CBS 101889]RAL10217.1 Six-hairpin glycosidase [Aspergillus homomorphus CBS 101889]
MTKVSPQEQGTINELQANWVWVPQWVDSSEVNTAGRLVRFQRQFSLSAPSTKALLHFSADTRYKLAINDKRVCVGPTRGSPYLWYYDTVNIAPYLQEGLNVIHFDVIRYFAATRGAIPFQRTSTPGLTVVGRVKTENEVLELNTAHTDHWLAQVDGGIQFPMGLVDDPFLHINERIAPVAESPQARPKAYSIKTLNGELAPWRLRPRPIPMQEQSRVRVNIVRTCQSTVSAEDWAAGLSQTKMLALPAKSLHTLELQADTHSTAFLCWTFQAAKPSSIRLKVTYSEGYELDPRSYPFFRTKADRLEARNGHLIGPFDEVELNILDSTPVTYEPFWFRTFRLLRLEIEVGPEPVLFAGLEATQVNYPLAVKASWDNPADADSDRIWDVSIRTMRNCMFDGYADCPFYEQLQYSGDSRSLIAGFSLYWILQVCDHHLFFGDTEYTRSFLPRVDGVLEFFHSHVDELGLISGLPEDVWQYVDWVTSWGATKEHPDKGVPTSGRKSNCHTYFSLLYALVLQQAAQLVRDVGRPGHAEDYESRAQALRAAIREHCYDGRFFTDSTADIADEQAYSQHCQVFAILSGTAAAPEDQARLLRESFAEDTRFSKCSYMMRFYALRAFSMAGDEVYEGFWARAWEPYRKMLAQNLGTWEEDDVRQRSDCHAWGSVPIYEYCAEVAGIRPIKAGCKKILFKPRLGLSPGLTGKVALGRNNLAIVSWRTLSDGRKIVDLKLEEAVEVVSQWPGGEMVDHGVVHALQLVY